MKHNLPTDIYDEICQLLQDSKTPFEAVVSRNRRTIKTGSDEYIFSDSDIPMKDLSLIKSVKDQMIKAGCNLKRKIGPQDIEFYKVGLNNDFPVFAKDVVEIDISKAYWTAAQKMGFIDRATYSKGLEIDKVSRLVAIGASAVVKWRFGFDGYAFSEVSEDFDANGRNAFFHICAEIASVMERAAGDVAHLLWVDAIFCSAKDADFVCTSLSADGYEYKRKDIVWAAYNPTPEQVSLSYLERLGEDEKKCSVRIKTFTFVKKKNKSFEKRAKKAHWKNLENHFF